VDIKADAPLLPLTYDEDFIFEPLALGEFGGEFCRAFVDPALEGILDQSETAKKPDDNEIEGQDNRRVPKGGKPVRITFPGQDVNKGSRDRAEDADEDSKPGANKPCGDTDGEQIEDGAGNFVTSEEIKGRDDKKDYEGKSDKNLFRILIQLRDHFDLQISRPLNFDFRSHDNTSFQ
jgi:hypothetical protein